MGEVEFLIAHQRVVLLPRQCGRAERNAIALKGQGTLYDAAGIKNLVHACTSRRLSVIERPLFKWSNV